MKKSIIAVAALLCLGAPGAAYADESVAELRAQLEQMTQRVAGLSDKVEHKNDLLACERGNRRELQRALHGREAGVVKVCR